VHPDLKTVIDLQQVDSRLAELASQITAVPSRIQAIETQLNDSLRAHEARKLRLSANQKERRDLEGDVKVVEERISKHKDQLYQVKTNEQYRAMQKEIGGEDDKIRQIEDRILEKMEEAEGLQKLVQEAAARLDEEQVRVAGEKKRLETGRLSAEAERTELLARRSVLADGLNAAVRDTYERVRRGRQGIAVAEVRDGFCAACNVRLRPQSYNEVRTGQGIVTCESCSRILYYLEPPADLSGLAEGENQRVVL
jgi:predicted  nucleic acid-binding Zn-ribbon protein